MPLGSGRVGSDDLGYGPGSGFSFEPVQTSSYEPVAGLNMCYLNVLSVIGQHAQLQFSPDEHDDE